MIFSDLELSAILRLAHAMANADGKITEAETAMIILELNRFGVDQVKAQKLAEIGDKMGYPEACQIVSRMTSEEKRYVTAYLGAMICIDGDIDESETKLWSLITVLCDLPREI
jgi:uncharacterized tellurite resistance protein B-like protein